MWENYHHQNVKRKYQNQFALLLALLFHKTNTVQAMILFPYDILIVES
jgi:hypothetical protein